MYQVIFKGVRNFLKSETDQFPKPEKQKSKKPAIKAPKDTRKSKKIRKMQRQRKIKLEHRPSLRKTYKRRNKSEESGLKLLARLAFRYI